MEVAISDVVYGGLGLARVEGYVIFVPGVLPGERVLLGRLNRRRRFAKAELARVVSASPHRLDPVCPLAMRPTEARDRAAIPCPGCAYQHATYEEEIRIKQRQIEAHLRRATREAGGSVLPPVAAPRELGYRNKIVLHGARKPWRLGYVAEDNRTILDVPACPLAVEPINGLLAERRQQRRYPSAVTLRYTQADGPLCWSGKPAADAPDLTERTAIGDVRVPRACFFQVNLSVADRLLMRIGQKLAEVRPDHFLDVYCGVGMFGLLAASRGVERVVGIESDRRAVQAAEQNAAARGARATRWLAAPAWRVLEAELDRSPLHRTVVLVDPPRTGLEPRVREILLRRRPRRLWYISCAPDTLARDLADLVGEGLYRLRDVQLFDMFPRTPHFEVVADLESRSAAGDAEHG